MLCKYCNQSFDSKSHLYQHVREVHQPTVNVTFPDSVRVEVTRDTESNQFKCPRCSFTSNIPRNIWYHCRNSCNQSAINQPQTTEPEVDRGTEESLEQQASQPILLSTQESLPHSEAFDVWDDDDEEMEEFTDIMTEQQPDPTSSTAQDNDYNEHWQEHGLLIHIPSGIVICTTCREAISFFRVAIHWSVVHKVQLENTPGDFLAELLNNQASEEIKEEFKRTLTVHQPIEGLKSERGYQCNQCQPTEPFYHNNLSRVKDHLYRNHRGHSQDYQAITVQRLFSSTNEKCFVRVESNIITEESTTNVRGEELVRLFLATSPDAAFFTEPNYGIPAPAATEIDTRTLPQFYVDVQWDTYFAFFGKDNNQDNRIKFYEWVSGAMNSSNYLYSLTEQSVTEYANYIQGLLGDRRYHYLRQRAKSTRVDQIDPVGLKQVQEQTLTQYIKSWTRYIIMLLKVTMSDIVDNNVDLNNFYHGFHERILTQDQLEKLEAYVQQLQTQPYNRCEVLGRLHELFFSLLCCECPPAHLNMKTSSNVFIAFSQLDWQGNWKSVNSVTKMPARFMYLTRCVVFYHCVVLQTTSST